MCRYLKFMGLLMLICLVSGVFFPASTSAQNFTPQTNGITERVSINTDGRQGNRDSRISAVSADGRFVAFISVATNLVEGDTNGFTDVFVHDRMTGETTRVSVASDGTQSNDELGERFISISADGRYVAFDSWATNLVEVDTNNYCYDYGSMTFENCPDVFVNDRWTGETMLVSVASDGTQGNEFSLDPFISADGRFVAFQSAASNLVDGDTNDRLDIFVNDRFTGETTRVSIASDGAQANNWSGRPYISLDGDSVAFVSRATNLVEGGSYGCNIFVHNRATGETKLVSVDSNGIQGNSSSGYLYPLQDHYRPSISADGRFVVFQSASSNLVEGDTEICWWWEMMHIIYYNCSDIFVHDLHSGETTRVSIYSDGTQIIGDSLVASISGDGRYVAFDSWSKMVPWEYNYRNTFLHDRSIGVTSIISISSDGIAGNGDSDYPSISANGRFLTFNSLADNLVVGDKNKAGDIFMRHLDAVVVDYSVSGHVADSNGDPLPGVNISAGYGYSDITDSQGNYMLLGLQSGTYQITVSLADFSFFPLIREISVPPERANINFTQGYPAFVPLIIR